MSEPTQEAVHEAGHAIMGVHFGLRVREIRLTPNADNGRLGYVKYAEDLMRIEPDQWIISVLAGRAAQREVCKGAVNLTRLDEQAAEDLQNVTAWLEAIYPGHDDEQLTRADGYARAFAITHARLIVALAKELDRRGRMTGQELHTFIVQELKP